MRVADYVVDFISRYSPHVFMGSGGSMMYLSDSVACSAKVTPVHLHHEQALTMAMVSYARLHGFGVAIVTSGCGSTNALTGVLSAWQDGIPCMVISGQSSSNLESSNSNARQRGVQEVNIVRVAESITKYITTLKDPWYIAWALERAMYEAMSDRPAPVWVDIPLNIQNMEIKPEVLRHFPTKPLHSIPQMFEVELAYKVLMGSKRPIVIAGGGIRQANAISEFSWFIEKFQLPFVTTFSSTDILPSDHPYYVGRVGIKGDRVGNQILSKADCILALGTRLSIPTVGYEYKDFGRDATTIVVNIDDREFRNRDTTRVDQLILADVGEFICMMTGLKKLEESRLNTLSSQMNNLPTIEE